MLAFVLSDLGIGSVLLFLSLSFCFESVSFVLGQSCCFWVCPFVLSQSLLFWVCLVVSSQSCCIGVGWFWGCYLGHHHFVLRLSFCFVLSLFLPGSQLCQQILNETAVIFTFLCSLLPCASCAGIWMKWQCIPPALLCLEVIVMTWVFQNFLNTVVKNEEEGIPRDLQNFDQIERKRGVLSP